MAHSRVSCSSKSVKIAGSKSAKTAVAETCVRLIIVYFIKIDAVVAQHLLYLVHEFEVVKACFKWAAHEKFHRKVVDLLAAYWMSVIYKWLSFLSKNFHNYWGEHLINLLVRSFLRGNAVKWLELFGESFSNLFHKRVHFIYSHNLLHSPAEQCSSFWKLSHGIKMMQTGSCKRTPLPEQKYTQTYNNYTIILDTRQLYISTNIYQRILHNVIVWGINITWK